MNEVRRNASFLQTFFIRPLIKKHVDSCRKLFVESDQPLVHFSGWIRNYRASTCLVVILGNALECMGERAVSHVVKKSRRQNSEALIVVKLVTLTHDSVQEQSRGMHHADGMGEP